MKVAAIIEYSQDKERIAQVRPAHRRYLGELLEQGQLAASGPFTDDSGALIIYEAGSPQEAERFLQADPFYQNGIMVSYRLRPWNPVLAGRAPLTG